MSIGNPKIIVRLEQDLIDLIEQTMERRNKYTSRGPWTLSDFVRQAIREKIDHMRRARRRASKVVPGTIDINSGLSAPQEEPHG